MANAAVLTTCDLPTAVDRESQPLALTSKQKEAVERTWKLVEGVGLMEAGLLLFKRCYQL